MDVVRMVEKGDIESIREKMIEKRRCRKDGNGNYHIE